MNIEEIRSRLKEIRERLDALKADAETRSLTDEESTEIDNLLQEFEEKRSDLTKLEERESRLAAVRDTDLGDERGGERGEDRRAPYTGVGRRTPEDVYDVEAYRSRARSEDDYRDLLQDGVKRAVETAVFPDSKVAREDQQEHIERLMVTVHRGKEDPTQLERMILETGSPEYRKAFGKYLTQTPLTHEEQVMLARAASTSSAAGGYAIPFTLDPTVILTSNGAVNPYRQIARVVQVTTNNWHGVTSGGITASYDAEAAEVSDDTPTLAQPSVTVEMARAFVPFSIEIGGDWSGFQAEMASEFADAKDVLEESKFTTGAGHGSTEPEGIITGATVTVSSASTAVLALADVYSVANALPARWEGNASWLGHKTFYNKIKALAQATGGNVGVWADIAGDGAPRLNGDPAYKGTTISSQITTSNQKVAVYGDFRQFLIVDRIGMSVELIPHLFATANNLPAGQRGLFCYWRNSSKCLVPAAFRVLKVL